MYNASGVVKQSAFLPYPRTETSVFRKSRMSKKDYVGSKAYVSGIKGKSMKAVALIDVQCIAPSLGVSIEPEESDYPWHANIVGWPAKKHEQKSIAQQLAKISTIE